MFTSIFFVLQSTAKSEHRNLKLLRRGMLSENDKDYAKLMNEISLKEQMEWNRINLKRRKQGKPNTKLGKVMIARWRTYFEFIPLSDSALKDYYEVSFC